MKNWEFVRREWRKNQLSNREIARLHFEKFGVKLSESAIRKRAQENRWTRILGSEIAEAVELRLIQVESEPDESAQNAHVSRDHPTDYHEIIERAADQTVAIIRSHRSDISRHRKRFDGFGEMTDHLLDHARANKSEVKALAMVVGSLANALAKSTQAMGTLISLERQAFGIDKAYGGTGSATLGDEFGEDAILIAADEINARRE